MDIQDKENQFAQGLSLPTTGNFFVIVGGNNSGKSTILRSIVKSFGDSAYHVDVNRTLLKGEGAQNKSYLTNYKSYTTSTNSRSDDNSEGQTQILQDFFRLKNKERVPIIDWYNKYFPNYLIEEREDADNDASPLLLKQNGYSITKQGSGMRSTLEIFIKLFDPEVKVLCIDEPELGLEPVLQKYLLQAIKEKAAPDKKIVLATHSHHFLDHEEISNNFICERNSDGKISISPATDLQPVIFRLLGNTLGSLMLPEKILILEGASDNTFLTKCLLFAGKKNYAVHSSGGTGQVAYAINSITQFLKFNKSHLPVYRENVFVLVDKLTPDINVREWKKLLPGTGQIKELPSNGIEYFYPERVLQEVFKTGKSKTEIVDAYLASKPNRYNDVTLTKTELAKRVVELLKVEDLDEPENQLFEYIKTLP